MSFLSLPFFLLLPIALVLWWRRPARWRWLPGLAVSYLFYGWYQPWLLCLILLTTLTSYGCALAMSRTEDPRERRRWAVLAAAVCLAVLFVFKYLDFALGGIFALSRLFGGSGEFSGFRLLLPMGISFYVFQTMSYTFDVCRGKVEAERHLGWYALFVAFFPQLVAGPIERPGDLLPQLRSPDRPGPEGVSRALRLLLRGYAKKVLIADLLALAVDAAYGDPAASGGALVTATVLFGLQVYCDFSGYSDIALGCAALLGVRLTENFRRPYAAVTLRDFWRRWHVSLTRWFTDYLYIPLGGSRRGELRTCRNLLLVFLVSGLWHGADVTFLLWGLLHGLFLVLERLLFGDRLPASAPGRVLRRCLTLLAVGFAWVFFRAPDLDAALDVLGRILLSFRPADLLAGLGDTPLRRLTTLLLAALLPWLEGLPHLPVSASDEGERSRCAAAALSWLLVVLALWMCRCAVLTQGGSTSFLYFQF